MLKLSRTERIRFLLLIPFAYALLSRMNSAKALASNTVTVWIPGLLVVLYYSDFSTLSAAGRFVIAYYAFICVYEIGYFVNDTYGLRRDATPRRRIALDYSPFFCAAFILIRLAVFIALSWRMDWLASPLWYSLFGALAVVMALHNLIVPVQFKLATFFQMSLLRFIIPVGLSVGREHLLTIIMLAVFNYVYVRFIVYLAAKKRLALPERHERRYSFIVHALFLPSAVMMSVVAADNIFWLMTLYYVMAFALYGLARMNTHGSRILSPEQGQE